MVNIELVNGKTVTVPGNDGGAVLARFSAGAAAITSVTDIYGARVQINPAHIVQVYAIPDGPDVNE